MVRKKYDWTDGAKLEDHTAAKLRILRQYAREYISVRCQIPHQSKFRLAIIDGFCGAGRYKGGEAGSPIVFLEEVIRAARDLNTRRKAEGFSKLQIDCLLIFNDVEKEVIELLKANVAPLQQEAASLGELLHIEIVFKVGEFEKQYPDIREMIWTKSFTNVMFVLDQCGHAQVPVDILRDIVDSFNKVEMFYNFSITSFLAYLSKKNPARLASQTAHLGKGFDIDQLTDAVLTDQHWLGLAERLVYDAFFKCADYVSPFSINNPKGWRYWLIHFARSYRAREVYNNILHENASVQAHFGRPGLKMLSYDEPDAGSLYLFNPVQRIEAIEQLIDDIPRMVASGGDAMTIREAFEKIYSETPAHSNDIRAAMLQSSDLEVLTSRGYPRRTALAIRTDDVLKLRPQKSFHWLMTPSRPMGNS